MIYKIKKYEENVHCRMLILERPKAKVTTDYLNCYDFIYKLWAYL